MKLLICTQTVDKNHPILGFFHGWILEFAQHFSEVHVICLEKGRNELPDHVHVYSLGKEAGATKLRQLLRFYVYFWQIFFQVRPTFVFFHMGAIFNILAIPFYLLRTWYQSKFYWWKTHGQINVTGRVAAWFVDQIYTAAEASFPIKSRKRKVIGHAIDTDLFTFNTKDKTIDILFAGRFSRIKKIEQVVLTAKQIQIRMPDLRVVLVGMETDPVYTAEIKALIVEQGVTENIEIRPPAHQAELVGLYQESKVFMNPSEHDGLDKVILEAMASGAIPITGNLAFADILKSHDLFMHKGDIAGFAKRITEILKMTSTDLDQLSLSLRNTVIERHSLATLTKRIFNHD